MIRNYYMTFSISALVSSRDSYANGSRADTRDDMENLFITYFTFFQAVTFILQKRSLNWQIAKKILKRVAFVQLGNIFVSSFVQ